MSFLPDAAGDWASRELSPTEPIETSDVDCRFVLFLGTPDSKESSSLHEAVMMEKAEKNSDGRHDIVVKEGLAYLALVTQECSQISTKKTPLTHQSIFARAV